MSRRSLSHHANILAVASASAGRIEFYAPCFGVRAPFWCRRWRQGRPLNLCHPLESEPLSSAKNKPRSAWSSTKSVNIRIDPARVSAAGMERNSGRVAKGRVSIKLAAEFRALSLLGGSTSTSLSSGEQSAQFLDVPFRGSRFHAGDQVSWGVALFFLFAASQLRNPLNRLGPQCGGRPLQSRLHANCFLRRREAMERRGNQSNTIAVLARCFAILVRAVQSSSFRGLSISGELRLVPVVRRTSSRAGGGVWWHTEGEAGLRLLPRSHERAFRGPKTKLTRPVGRYRDLTGW